MGTKTDFLFLILLHINSMAGPHEHGSMVNMRRLGVWDIILLTPSAAALLTDQIPAGVIIL